MKKRLLTFLLCLGLMLAQPSVITGAADGDVYFTAVNDNLLELSVTPYFSGGVTYLPYSVFTDYGFGIHYTYFSDTSTAMLYTTDKQLFFSLSSGGSYDGDDKTYTNSAVMRSGTVYLPASFMCSFFGGMSCTDISGSQYGTVVRLKDSRVVLTDEQFIRAASTLMKNRYEAYKFPGGVSPSPSAPGKTETHEGMEDTLSFIGLPTTTILSALRRYGSTACFFLTESDVLSSPDLVRRIVCDGHSVGVYCSGPSLDEFEATAGLIYSVAREKTLLVTTPGRDSAAQQTALQRGLVYWSYDIDGMSTGSVHVSYDNLARTLDKREGSSSVFLSCDENTDAFIAKLLKHLTDSLYEVRSPRETDVWSR